MYNTAINVLCVGLLFLSFSFCEPSILYGVIGTDMVAAKTASTATFPGYYIVSGQLYVGNWAMLNALSAVDTTGIVNMKVAVVDKIFVEQWTKDVCFYVCTHSTVDICNGVLCLYV